MRALFALGAIVAQGIGLNSGLLANHLLVSVLFRFLSHPPLFHIVKSGESEEWDLLVLSGFVACATLNMNSCLNFPIAWRLTWIVEVFGLS